MVDENPTRGIQRLVEEISECARETSMWTKRESFSQTTMAAIANVHRDRFLMPGYKNVAFANRPQPIGYGQTISQPYIVALMTDLLELKGSEQVLEIGSGSGYQAAVLAEILDDGHVYTIELVYELALRAERALRNFGYSNVTLKHGNGYHGWAQKAPFDAIIVTAASDRVPDPLVEQLKVGGRLAIPIGRPSSQQNLVVAYKDNAQSIYYEKLLPVKFVPFIHP
ncbi:MAG: protein-L-isoaspartate O-methyltransferase [Magnetovibrio sp.]|nr:protein-L-isoaspartate O-methyltransferase [Magnetovibrio sp.]